MLYQDYVDLTTNLLNQRYKVPTEDILSILADYADKVPSLPYEALLRIRRLGYISGKNLAAMIHQCGFNMVVIDHDTAIMLRHLNGERGGKNKWIRPHKINLLHQPKRLLQDFAKYTGVKWLTGKLVYSQNTKQLTIPTITPPKVTKSSIAPEQVAQWDARYRAWIGPGEPEAARQHFLAQYPEFRTATDTEMIDAIQTAWRDGSLGCDVSADAAVMFLTTHCKVIPLTTRPYKHSFSLFCSPERLSRIFAANTGKTFAQARAAAYTARQHKTAVSRAEHRDVPQSVHIVTIDVNGAAPEQVATLKTVVQALGFQISAE